MMNEKSRHLKTHDLQDATIKSILMLIFFAFAYLLLKQLLCIRYIPNHHSHESMFQTFFTITPPNKHHHHNTSTHDECIAMDWIGSFAYVPPI